MIRILRVYHEQDGKMYLDFFKEEEWFPIVETFFLEGGLLIPEEIDEGKDKESLTEEDYALFFEKLGYTILGFETVKEKELRMLKTFVNMPSQGVPKKWKN